MTEINLGRLPPDVQQQLKSLVYDENGRDNTDISRNCFVFEKDDLVSAQETINDLQCRVNFGDQTPNMTSIFGRTYGENIIVFWRARVTEAIKIAIISSNSDRRKSGMPTLPPLT